MPSMQCYTSIVTFLLSSAWDFFEAVCSGFSCQGKVYLQLNFSWLKKALSLQLDFSWLKKALSLQLGFSWLKKALSLQLDFSWWKKVSSLQLDFAEILHVCTIRKMPTQNSGCCKALYLNQSYTGIICTYF